MIEVSKDYNLFYYYKLRTVNHDILVSELKDIENEHDREMFIRGFLCSEIYNNSKKIVDKDGNYKTITGSLVEPYELSDGTYGFRYFTSKRDVLDNNVESS